MIQVEAPTPRVAAGQHRRQKFFAAISVVLLVAVLAGFARTFFLRGLLGRPPMPVHLYVHGIILTAWFALFVVQAFLVSAGRTRVHRRIGTFGVGLAAAVVAISLVTVARRDAPIIDERPFSSFGNVWSVIAFATCVGIAVAHRHRPDVHKRMMLLGSILITAPALDRMALIPALTPLLAPYLPEILGSTGETFALLSTISLMLAVIAYDVVSRRRPHWATLGGIAAIWLLTPAMTAGVFYLGAWTTFVKWVS